MQNISMRPDAAVYIARPDWYRRIIERFDLVRLRDCVDWLAYRPGAVMADEELRATAYRRFFDSIECGEFNRGGKAIAVWLPEDITAVRPSHLRLRASAGRVAFWRQYDHPCLKELWLPRQLAGRWFAERDLNSPIWLRPGKIIDGEVVVLAREGDTSRIADASILTAPVDTPLSYKEVKQFLSGLHGAAVPETQLRRAIEKKYPCRRLLRKHLRGAIYEVWGAPGRNGRPPKSPNKSPQE